MSPGADSSSSSSGANKSHRGWLAKCGGHLLSALSGGDRHDAGGEDPNRPVRQSGIQTGSKRKRSPVTNSTTRVTLTRVLRKTSDQMEVKSKSDEKSPEVLEYEKKRQQILKKENDAAWDRGARNGASKEEITAGEIILKIREYERDYVFGNKASEDLPGPTTLDMGGQFLTNKHRIETESALFKIAKTLPKGAIQHLHFNAELHPERLIEVARSIKNMYVYSKRPLLTREDLDLTEIIFDVKQKNEPTGNIFEKEYCIIDPQRKPQANKAMGWGDFRTVFNNRFGDEFPEKQPKAGKPRENGHLQDSSAPAEVKLDAAERWIKQKMVLSEEEAYRVTQTVNGVWARFNQATRCFKGLMNYEHAFEWYIGNAIECMIEEGIMYAELRPMLLDKSIPSTDGTRRLAHAEQMRLILKCVEEKQTELEDRNMSKKFPFGLKIIYCTPRSIPKPMMKREMEDCIALKKEFPDLICGFDLVGAEDRANHIGYYYEELVNFSLRCKEEGVEIPFMFHAGETLLDTGGSKLPSNSNLYDAALLESKRIGHGFSLMKHPQLVEEFKRQDICIELCPISNELLHLCRNVKEHPFPQLLAAGIPCSLNSDNPSLFSNSMSHEFYQVMVGWPAMTIHGWKQLAWWSLEYSCLNEDQKEEAKKIYAKEWDGFCKWVINEYGEIVNQLGDNGQVPETLPPRELDKLESKLGRRHDWG